MFELDHRLTQLGSEVNNPSLQCLVVAGGELGEEIVLVEREVLNESHGHDLLLGINLAIGRGGAVPAELSDRRRNRELPEVGRYFHTESKASS